MSGKFSAVVPRVSIRNGRAALGGSGRKGEKKKEKKVKIRPRLSEKRFRAGARISRETILCDGGYREKRAIPHRIAIGFVRAS